MSLILAIESDHRQAGHLVQIVRHRLGAELILAESFEAALPAIGNWVPDLILVPALMSPEDDAALKFVLRFISHGSHVQVLTTPMIAGSCSESSSRGMLPGFLRTRTKSAADGCDPEEFARHIASYLKAADEKRSTSQPPVISPTGLEYDAATPWETESVAEEDPVAQWITPIEAVDEASAPVVVWEDVSDLSEPVAAIDTATEMELAVEPVTLEVSVAPAPTEAVAEEDPVAQWITPIEAVDEASAPVVVWEDVSDLSEPVAAIDMASEMGLAVEPVTLEVSVANARPARPVVVDNDALDRLVSDISLRFAAAQVTPVGVPAGRAPVRGRIAYIDNHRGSVAPAPTLEQLAAEVDSKFEDLSAAVIERENIEPLPTRVEAHPDRHSMGDEWGLYDPEQCGIEAVLVKVKEITDREPPA